MKLNFYVRFHTKFGENLRITGNINELGNFDSSRAFPMQYLNDEFWKGSIEVEPAGKLKIQYNYILVQQDGEQISDWGKDRIVDLSKIDSQEIDVIDAWNPANLYDNVFLTSPFQDVLLAEQHGKGKQKVVKTFTHIFKVKAPLVKKNESVCLLGNALALGEWDIQKPLRLAKEGSWWTIKLDIPRESFPLQYKYGIYNEKEETVVLETGANRQLQNVSTEKTLTILHDGFVRRSDYNWRGAGVAIPVFSLRSRNSFGVGEFTDLQLLADWAKETGLKLIQILPVNDTTATHTFADSYPYAAISAFALHPIYINLEEVSGKKNAELIKQLRKKQKQLNEGGDLDYEQVIRLKLAALEEIYQQQKKSFLSDPDYLDFFQQNRHWLVPYAAFCYLRDKNGTANFNEWKTHSVYKKEEIEKYVAPKSRQFDDIAIHYFIQYHLHLQLKAATEYAHKKGIIVKGDIPIGVYRYSCDAWMNPDLFHLDMQAGAPPDDFAVKGQNWGFPTYNWQKMQETHFAWWRQRFEQMSNYFDAFRVDHILGFFRIWSIPLHAVEGILGYFVPAIPVSPEEMKQRGIGDDHGRYTKPYINDKILEEIFGDEAGHVKTHYLTAKEDGLYQLKEEFNTQRKVDSKLSVPGESNEDIRNGLFDLISNVIFLEEEGSGGKKFHFRFAMESTPSFKYLDRHIQQQLNQLYIDYFFHRQESLWKKEAMHKLPDLKASTNMLICGEDLGMVPHCVPDVMQQLGILSLEIQRMPKAMNREFFHPNHAPYLSVVTPSTHDMSTIRGWWKEDPEKMQRFYNHELGQWGEAPRFAEAWICKAVILQHLYSPAMWSIFQLQDIISMSESLRAENPDNERINIPANPRHYWRYRMHFTLEHLIKEKTFNHELKTYVHASGR